MNQPNLKCVLLAARHPGLAEGMRGLLESMFDAVVMVADSTSLLESAGRLQPTVAVAELSLAREGNLGWVRHLHERCPGAKLVLLGVHDAPSVRRAVLAAGADGYVLERAIATDLLPTIESVLADRPTPPETSALVSPP